MTNLLMIRECYSDRYRHPLCDITGGSADDKCKYRSDEPAEQSAGGSGCGSGMCGCAEESDDTFACGACTGTYQFVVNRTCRIYTGSTDHNVFAVFPIFCR